MTNKELSQIYHLNEEKKFNEDRLQELQTRATKTTPTLSLTPGATNNNNSKFESGVDERLELESKIIELNDKIEKETLKIQKYINNIDDSLIRRIITYRCIYCWEWVKVAKKIGGGNKPDGVRKKYSRYISEH